MIPFGHLKIREPPPARGYYPIRDNRPPPLGPLRGPMIPNGIIGGKGRPTTPPKWAVVGSRTEGGKKNKKTGEGVFVGGAPGSQGPGREVLCPHDPIRDHGPPRGTKTNPKRRVLTPDPPPSGGGTEAKISDLPPPFGGDHGPQRGPRGPNPTRDKGIRKIDECL